MVEAYCVKCKKKGQKMKEAVMTRTAKGGFMAKGKCPDCDKHLYLWEGPSGGASTNYECVGESETNKNGCVGS